MALTRSLRNNSVKFSCDHFPEFQKKDNKPAYGAFPIPGSFALLRATDVLRHENESDEIVIAKLRDWMKRCGVSALYDIFEKKQPKSTATKFFVKCISVI